MQRFSVILKAINPPGLRIAAGLTEKRKEVYLVKITHIEYIPASKYLFIKIHTDAGITGIGEVGAWGYIDGVHGVLKKLEGYLIGQDPPPPAGSSTTGSICTAACTSGAPSS